MSVALISVNPAGAASVDSSSMLGGSPYSYGGRGAASHEAAISADGHVLVFESDAPGLSGGVADTNAAPDVFARDAATGKTHLVSVAPDGRIGDGSSTQPIVSPDGRYVAFLSAATNLSSVAASKANPTDGPPLSNLYIRDLRAGTTKLLDVAPDGKAANGFATGKFAFSPDSSTLAFTDTSTNLTDVPPGKAPSSASDPKSGPLVTPFENLYLHDLAAGKTTAVSVTPDGKLSEGNTNLYSGYGGSSDLVFSPDGKRLAFTSTATDLTANPPDKSPGKPSDKPSMSSNLYVRDLSARTTTLVSVTPDGHVADRDSIMPVFSPDGGRLAFLSNSTNLVAGAPVASRNGGDPYASGFIQEAYVRDLAAGKTTAVSVMPDGKRSSGYVSEIAFSPDGKALAFISSGTDLTSHAVKRAPAGATGSRVEGGGILPSIPTPSSVFLRDLSAGTTRAVSVTPDGKLSDGHASGLAFSPDGKTLAYLSGATDLTANPFTPPPAPPSGTDAPTNKRDKSMNMTVMPSLPGNNLFLNDLATGKTTLVSVTPDGKLSFGNVMNYSFSPDSRSLAFIDPAIDLMDDPTAAGKDLSPRSDDYRSIPYGQGNLFVRDLTTQTTTLVTRTTDGTLAGDQSYHGATSFVFSPDGKTLYFSTGTRIMLNVKGGTAEAIATDASPATSNEIGFATSQFNANESDGRVDITVVRGAPLEKTVSVDYAVRDGTAKAGNDYQATSGTLNFGPGQSSATFKIPLNAAASFKEIKTATITLSNPIGAILSPSTATATLNLSGVMRFAPRLITSRGSTTWVAQPTIKAPAPTPTPTPTTTSTPTPSSTANTPPAAGTPGKRTGREARPDTKPGDTPTTKPSTTATTPDSTEGSSDATRTPETIEARSDAAKAVGPLVSNVTLRTARRKITGVVLSFDGPLAVAGANNVSNYDVRKLTAGRRMQHGTSQLDVGKPVRIALAQYDPVARTVALSFRSPLSARQAFQLRVIGGPNGITDPAGNPLNSPSPGTPGSDWISPRMASAPIRA